MALTAEQIEEKIDQINDMLDTGVTSTTIDGVTTSFSPGDLRKRKRELTRQLARLNGETGSRWKQIDFSGGEA